MWSCGWSEASKRCLRFQCPNVGPCRGYVSPTGCHHVGHPVDFRFTATEKLEAVERELKYRKRVYPRRVSENKMTQALADKQIALMEALAADYRAKAEGERLI